MPGGFTTDFSDGTDGSKTLIGQKFSNLVPALAAGGFAVGWQPTQAADTDDQGAHHFLFALPLFPDRKLEAGFVNRQPLFNTGLNPFCGAACLSAFHGFPFFALVFVLGCDVKLTRQPLPQCFVQAGVV